MAQGFLPEYEIAREHIAKEFRLDKKKMKRLADAMEVPNASGRSLLPRVTYAGLVTNGDEDYSVG